MFGDSYAHRLDAAELVVHAYDHWDRHRWPGASGRLAFAGTIYAAFVLRLLEDLSLRIWDGDGDAAQRLGEMQRLLDGLNGATPAGALMRDAAWLVETAQSAITRQLAPYFRVAERIAASFPGESGVALHAAGVKLAGGHLRSQLRQRAAELGRAPGDPAVLVVTRNSNAMDLALLAGDLVPLLEAHARAGHHDDRALRRRLADAIIQGLSADPELLLTRLDLLGPCSMLETVFVSGHAALTAAGTRHVRILDRYRELIAGAAAALAEDASALQPARGYSPFALVYGFCADLLSRMARDRIQGFAARSVTLEDLFESGGSDAIRQMVDAWGAEYSADWAAQTLADVVRALERRAAHPHRPNASETADAALRFVSGDAPAAGDADTEYCITSDVQLALSTGATAFPRSQFLMDRNEGRFLASAEVDGKWFGVSKAVLTERLAQGHDVVLRNVPQNVIDVLRLTCPNLLR